MSPKQRHDDASADAEARKRLMFLVLGALVVVGILAWALTRSVAPAPLPSTDPRQTPDIAGPAGATATQPPIQAPGALTPPSATNPALTASAPLTATVPEHAQTPDKVEVARITPEQLQSKIASGEAIVLDVRDDMSYQTAHIAGARHVPFARVEAEADALPKNKQIVTYCT